MNWTQRLARYYRTRIDPLFYKSRLLRRLATYDLDPQSEMMVARLDGAFGCNCSEPMCHHLFVTYGGYFDQFFYSTDQDEAPLYSKLTLHAIDLLRYESFADYRKELGRRSSFFLRNARQAGKLGYAVREFDPRQYEKDIAQIASSMKVRSFGPMWSNWLAQEENANSAFKRLPQNQHLCDKHWDRFIGVFAHGPNSMQGDLGDSARLVGYARLQRVGNTVAYEDLIGHRDFMGDGIMKLLHCHILHWLLDSDHADVQGLEYVVHGSIERGNDGIFFWKKKALFMPYLIELVATELPEDFVGAEYLQLNPDVKASGLDPASHYRLYGQKEGRHYQAKHLRKHAEDEEELPGDDQVGETNSESNGQLNSHAHNESVSKDQAHIDPNASPESMHGDFKPESEAVAVDPTAPAPDQPIPAKSVEPS